MTTGMFWLCDKKDLAEDIRAAADYYYKKYGRKPELCLLNVKLNEQIPNVDGLTIRTSRFVLPAHLWIGFEDMPTERKEVMPV